MSDRRFTDKPSLSPESVRSLPAGNGAILENRTLFPSTVVTVTENEPARLLVPGQNNRKIGKTVEKGSLKGAAIYMLSLEERATCSPDCELRGVCYGNGMQMARRHRIGDPEVFFDRMEKELADLVVQHGKVLVRLHVLGDFPSAAYVEFWSEMLDALSDLSVYGYTRWRPDDGDIGQEIAAVKEKFPDRFRIRWSGMDYDGAVVVDHIPDKPRIAEGIVCPAQTDATACCATCALCWDAPCSTNIAFIKHGPHSRGAIDAMTAETMNNDHPSPDGLRQISSLKLPKNSVPKNITTKPPEMRIVQPSSLFVEQAYQRDLSGASVRLIGKIVSNWDWSKFKPPVCAEIGGGHLAVIDGQHTAIAAANHGSIASIPVMVVDAALMQRRAAAFVSHNQDRLKMTQFSIFHAQVAAGDDAATRVAALLKSAGGEIPRGQPNKGYEKPGQFTSVNDVVSTCKRVNDKTALWILKVCVQSNCKPISRLIFRAVYGIAVEPYFSSLKDKGIENIAAALGMIHDADALARVKAVETGKSPVRAMIALIEENMRANA